MKKYIKYNDLLNYVEEVVENDQNDIREMEAMIVLLLREGVTIRQLINLRNSDFDFEKGTLTIKNNNSIRKLKLNEDTIKWVKKSRDSDGRTSGSRYIMKSLDDHIIKMSGEEYDVDQALVSVKRRLTKFRGYGLEPMTEGLLNTSKKVDILDKVLSAKGYVETEDFKSVQKQFGKQSEGYFKLRKDYASMRGEEVIKIGQRGRKPKKAN